MGCRDEARKELSKVVLEIKAPNAQRQTTAYANKRMDIVDRSKGTADVQDIKKEQYRDVKDKEKVPEPVITESTKPSSTQKPTAAAKVKDSVASTEKNIPVVKSQVLMEKNAANKKYKTVNAQLMELTKNAEVEKTDTTFGSEAEVDASIKNMEAIEKDIHKDTNKMHELLDLLGKGENAEHMGRLHSLIAQIKPEFLRNTHIFMNAKASKNMGTFAMSTGNMALHISPEGKVLNSDMSGAEVFSHETMHAYFGYALRSKDARAAKIRHKLEMFRRKARTYMKPEDLMPSEYTDEAYERRLAQSRYDYIFNNKEGNGLDEFLAYATTNEQFGKVLADKVPLKDDVKLDSLLDQIVHYAKKLLNLLTGNFEDLGKDADAEAAVFRLTMELAEYNNGAIAEAKSRIPGIGKVWEQLDKGNEFVKEKIDAYIEKLKEKNPLLEMPVNPTKWEYAKWMTKHMVRIAVDKDMKQYRELFLSMLGQKPEGAVQNILRDMTSADEFENSINRLISTSGQIDSNRETIAVTVKDYILEGFKGELSTADKEALTMVGMDLDMESIYDLYDNETLATLVEDKAALQKEIDKVRADLGKKDKKNSNWYINQADGLGHYMATHKAGIAQNLNADNIARKVLTDEQVDDAATEIVTMVDKLATLEGIRYTPLAARNRMARLLRVEKKGMDTFMSVYKEYKADAKKKLFRGTTTMIKGYTREVFDDSIDVVVKSTEPEVREEMEKAGYTLVSIPEKDKSDTSATKVGVYQSKMFVKHSYNKGATRLSNLTKRGTTLTDIEYSRTEDGSWDRSQIVKRKIEKDRIALVKKMQKQRVQVDQDAQLSPVLQMNGNVKDYRYMMSKQAKKEYMKQDTDGAMVLGRMVASIYDKEETAKFNNKVLDTIHEDMRNNYIQGLPLGRNDKEYIIIEENSDNKEVQEIYSILPRHLKHKIKKSTEFEKTTVDKRGVARKEGYIAVRRDMLHNYFGFRSLSAADSNFMKEFSPDAIRNFIRIAEEIWEAIVSISKVDIVIRTPIVLIQNVISNFMYHVQSGVNPITAMKDTLDNIGYVRQYIKDHGELERLKVAKATGNIRDLPIEKIASLEETMKRNPIYPLMSSGLYQAVIEDVSKQDFKSNNRVVKMLDNKMDGVPEFLKVGANWLYLSEKTGFFKFMTQATQFSDLIARATQYNYLTSKKKYSHKDAVQYVLDTYIDYNKPSGKMEQYFNDMGILMFTKYAKRVQRSLAQGIANHPVTFMLAQAFQSAVLDVEDITEQNILSKNWSMVIKDPLEHIERAVTPTLFEFVDELVPKS